MNAQFSPRIRDVMAYSKEEAIRLGNNIVSPEHIFLGILREAEGLAFEIIKFYDIDIDILKKNIETDIRSENNKTLSAESLPLMRSSERVLKIIYLEARSLKQKEINTGHLLLAIVKEENSLISNKLHEFGIDYFKVREYMENYKENKENPLSNDKPEEYRKEDPFAGPEFSDDDDELKGPFSGGEKGGENPKSSSNTPVLDTFGVDLTKSAEEGKLDPIVGRGKEIERIAQILSRRKKNNPILIGDPGVGKSAIAEGLAIRIFKKQVSRTLFDKRLVTLDLGSLVAGTKYRGQFEERIKALLNEISKTDNIILFIDEIHTIVGAGGATGSLDAANMLKPALARGEIQCIGATTLDEYRQNIEKDGALERRFQKVIVNPTSVEETLQILNNIKERYEDHHNVSYTNEAIDACVSLTNRYITDRHLPDKAIDALDEAGSRVHISNIVVPESILKIESSIEDIKNDKISAVKNQNFEKAASFRDKEREMLKELELEKNKWEEELIKNRVVVGEEHVAEVVAMMSGVPVQRIAQEEGQKLLSMKEDINNQVIGQEDAVVKIVQAIQRNRAGLKDPNKPIGSFIFLGPTGVGKTQLAKILAKFLFDTYDNLVRIDMSEYMEKFSVSRLVGAPPGYVGYEEGGILTEKVRHRPYSVILLDEIEKAHPDVFNILLQVLDEGYVTDSLGRKIDFKNTIIIMTSNIGTRQLKEFGSGVGFSTKTRAEAMGNHAKGVIEKALKRSFSPEFLNRIDDVITFNSLSKDDISKIIDIELTGLFSRIANLNLKMVLTDSAKKYIADKGYDEQYGARPLQRALQKYIEEPLAEIIIKNEVQEGGEVQVDYNEGDSNLSFKIVKTKGEKKDKKQDNAEEEENNKKQE